MRAGEPGAHRDRLSRSGPDDRLPAGLPIRTGSAGVRPDGASAPAGRPLDGEFRAVAQLHSK